MNTLNYKNVTYLSDKILSMFDAVNEHWHHVEGKHLHYFQLVVPLDYNCSAEDLNNLIRILCNSKQSINCIDNRSWWNSTFAGGCYNIIVRQESPESQIKVLYDLLLLSEKDCLDDDLQELQRRLIKVIPEAKSIYCSSVELKTKKDLEIMMLHAFNKISNPLLEGEAFTKIDRNVQRWLMQAVGKDIRCIGSLYLMLHQPYNL